MTRADNLDYHQELVGRALAHLIENGLRKVDIEPADYFDIMAEARGDEEEAVETFADVIEWMQSEGLITIANTQGMPVGKMFNGVQLTSKALAIIKQPQAQLGGSIQETVSKKDGLDRDTFSKIADALGSALGGFVKSMSTG